MDEQPLDAIHRLIAEIAAAKAEVRTVNEQLKEIMDQNDEYRSLQAEIKDLVAKRAEAKKILQADQDYQKIGSELAELKFKLKDLQEIMSHHLVTYYNQTQATQITDPQGQTHQVVITAKIGKPE